MGVNPSNSTILKQLVIFGRGSIGAITIASNKYGQYQKRRLLAQSATTAAQAAWRATLSAIGSVWGSLSADQRNRWNQYARGAGKVYARTPAATMSGAALMSGMSAVRASAGFPLIYDCPVTAQRPAAPMIESCEISATNEITLTFHVEQAPLVSDTGDICTIQVSKPVRAAAIMSPRSWQSAGFVDSFFAGSQVVVPLSDVSNNVGDFGLIQWVRMRRSLPDGRYSILGRGNSYACQGAPGKVVMYAVPWTTIMQTDQVIINPSDGSIINTVVDQGGGIAGLSFQVNSGSRGIDAVTDGSWVGPYTTTLLITGEEGQLVLPVTITAGANPYGVVWIPFPGSYLYLPDNGVIYMTGVISSFSDLQDPSPIGNYQLIDVFMAYDVFLLVDYELSGFITIEGDQGEYSFPYTIPPSFVPVLTGFTPDPATTIIDVSMSIDIATVGGQCTSVTDLGAGITGLSFVVLPTFNGCSMVTDGSWLGPYTTTLQLTGPSGTIDCPIDLNAGTNPYAFPQDPWIMDGKGSFQIFTPFGVGVIYDFSVVAGDNPVAATFINARSIGVAVNLPVVTELSGVLGIDGDQGYWELPFILPVQ